MIAKSKLKEGQIWWVQLSYSKSDSVGHEQSNKRPCLIIKNNKFARLTTIIPLTAHIAASRFPYTYLIKKTKINNLTYDSIALIFQIRSLSYKRFQTQIGMIDKEDLNRIKALIKDYFFS
ncbi:MAG: type II toxin-antitoxin system PemK/MazF family toxin [Candidatus Lokiarchaeota archaeon]|nr:type II toxin-antitoxin system PemK/MazF family toxin [Candidatus Lokiarchaeota archaeon]